MPTTWGFFGVDSIANLLIRHPVVPPKPDGYFGDVAGFKANVVGVETALLAGDLDAGPDPAGRHRRLRGRSSATTSSAACRAAPSPTTRCSRRRWPGCPGLTPDRSTVPSSCGRSATAPADRCRPYDRTLVGGAPSRPRPRRSIGTVGTANAVVPAEAQRPRADIPDRPGHPAGHRRPVRLAGAGGGLRRPRARPSSSTRRGRTPSASAPAPQRSSCRSVERRRRCGSRDPTRVRVDGDGRLPAPRPRGPRARRRHGRGRGRADRGRCRWTGGAARGCPARGRRTSPTATVTVGAATALTVLEQRAQPGRGLPPVRRLRLQQLRAAPGPRAGAAQADDRRPGGRILRLSAVDHAACSRIEITDAEPGSVYRIRLEYRAGRGQAAADLRVADGHRRLRPGPARAS